MDVRLNVVYSAATGTPNGAYLTVRPLPEKSRVLSVFDEHTFLVVNDRKELCSIQMFGQAAIHLGRINRILTYFGEKPLERLL